MRILLFSSYFHPYTSGLTTYPWHLLQHLRKEHPVQVLTFPHTDLPKKEEKKDTKQPANAPHPLRIHRMPYLAKISKGYLSPQSLAIYTKETTNADIVFLNLPNFEGLPLALIARLRGKKVVGIYHCQVFLGADLLSWMVNLVLNIAVAIQLACCHTIVAYTQDYVHSIPMMRLFRSKIRYTLPPMPTHTTNREKKKKLLTQKKNAIWIGYAGRIAREKGLEYLIEAVQCIGDARIQLVFAGPYGKDVAGEDFYYTSIRQKLEHAQIPYHFLGNLHEADLAAWYQSIDILALPSINQTEAFGMVQPEAMRQGTPVITSNLPGVRVPIQLTGMGIITEPKDTIGIASAIQHILKNKKTYTNPNLVTKAQRIFDDKKVYAFYEKLMEVLILV